MTSTISRRKKFNSSKTQLLNPTILKTKIILLTVSLISLVLAGCATCGSKTCSRKASSTPIVINRTLGAYKVTIRATNELGVPLEMFHAFISLADLPSGWKDLSNTRTDWKDATKGEIVFYVNQIEPTAKIVVANNTNDIFCNFIVLPAGIQQNVELNLTLKKCPTVQSHQ